MTSFEQQKSKWEKQKARGKVRFILLHVLFWVMYAAALATLDILIFAPGFLSDANRLITHYIVYILIAGVPGGLLYGNLLWRAKVKRFGKIS